MASREYVDVPVLALDIERSSRHPGTGQAQAHRELRHLVDEACAELGFSLSEDDRADRGDGDNIVVGAPIALERLVADLPRELAGGLDRINRDRNAEGRLRVRLAVHRGPIWRVAGRGDGHAVVDVRRLLDAEAAHALLAGNPRAALVVVLSQSVFDATVRERLRHLHPDDWTHFTVGDQEKGSGLTGHGRLLGRGVPDEAVPMPAPRALPGARAERHAQGNFGPVAQGDYSPAVSTTHGDVIGRHG